VVALERAQPAFHLLPSSSLSATDDPTVTAEHNVNRARVAIGQMVAENTIKDKFVGKYVHVFGN